MKRPSAYYSVLLAASMLIGAGCETTDEEQPALDEYQTRQEALTSTCSISVGGGGETETITLSSSESAKLVNTTANWDFIRETSGPCRFTIYNGKNGSSKYVILGTDLKNRIRAGEEGIRYKDDGGGETWRIRSIRIERQSSGLGCFLNIGGNGVRMKYYPGSYIYTPAMDRITYFLGGNCEAKVWNGTNFGASDEYNRFKALHTNALTETQGQSREIYDPGFRIRSMKIESLGQQTCTASSPNYDFGRCLPIFTLERSIFDSSHNNYRDDDGDGLDDEMENKLAEAFRPIVVNDSSENATRHAVYTDVTGASVIEPVVAFQVRQSAIHSNAITLMYMKLWMNDKGGGCGEHKGDTQSTPIHLMTPSGQEYGKKWWLYSTSYNPTNITSSTASSNAPVSTSNVSEDENFDMETIAEQEAKEKEELLLNNETYDFYSDSDLERMALNSEAERSPSEKDADKAMLLEEKRDGAVTRGARGAVTEEFNWTQGKVALRAPYFERLTSAEQVPMHPVIHLTKGKHHEYQDGGWSGQEDKKCTFSFTAEMDSRGESANTPLPKRALNLRSPNGKGDRWNYNNVGSRDRYAGFMNSLDAFGFSGKKIWEDACFYSSDARAADRSFYCSNNVNQACCLEDYPSCTIKSSWTCH